MPLVSIIIPCHNAATAITRSLRSAYMQTHPDREIIIVDDGSDCDLASELGTLNDGTLLVIRRQCAGGPAAARNVALARARGTFIQFLDAGDTITPEKIVSQLNIFDRYPMSSAVFSDYRIHYPCGWGEEVRFPGGDVFGCLLRGYLPAIHTALFRTDTLRDMGGFDEGLLQCEDWDLWLRLLAQGQSCINFPIVQADYFKENTSITRDLDGWLTGIDTLLEKRRADPSFCAAAGTRASYFYAGVCFLVAWRLLVRMKVVTAVRYLAMSLTQSPAATLQHTIKLGKKLMNLRKDNALQ